MAATWTLLKSAPHSAVYRISSADGNPGVLNYAGADFTALVPGPYKSQIQKWLGSLDGCNLDSASTNVAQRRRFRIYRVGGQPAPDGVVSEVPLTLAWTANGISATLSTEVPIAILIEIRLIHSSRR